MPGEWREQYEASADQEMAAMSKWTDEQLLAAIRQANTGGYYTIWQVVGSRKPTAQLCWILIGILESNRDYLDRYHCAAALIRLIGASEFEPVHLSAGGEVRKQSIARMKALVEKLVGLQSSHSV
jgi:hypothetical protein